MAEVASRGQIAVSGRDRASYLHGLLTNDVQGMRAGQGCYAAWLTAQGRMTTDMYVLESGDMMMLDVPSAQTESILARLDQFIFTEDVQLANLSDDMTAVGVHGPHAPALVARVLSATDDLNAWPECHNARLAFGAVPVVVVRIDQLGGPGFTLYVARSSERDVRYALEQAGVRAVSADAVTAARIESGYPVFGIDMDDQIIPLEVGIESRLISFTKGCYPGQEVIIRVLHRGGGRVVKKLVGLRVEEGSTLPSRSVVQVDGKDVGFVTSGARSPQLGSIALAYVHRDFIEPGSRVSTVAGAATVSALPFRSA